MVCMFVVSVAAVLFSASLPPELLISTMFLLSTTSKCFKSVFTFQMFPSNVDFYLNNVCSPWGKNKTKQKSKTKKQNKTRKQLNLLPMDAKRERERWDDNTGQESQEKSSFKVMYLLRAQTYSLEGSRSWVILNVCTQCSEHV